FSRGAYTVRVLAGLIHKVGLISPQQANLAGSGLTSYKQFSSDGQHGLGFDLKALTDGGSDDDGPLPLDKDDQAAQFARILSTRWPTIRFVGVWDTVASVIVPRPDRLYWPSLEELAFTLENPSVKTFRQAISIDERRCMFRLKQWDQPQTYNFNRFSKTNNSEPQDILQVWFAGVHSDIGGGYPEVQSGLSKYPLLWMIDEAVKCGLQVDQRTVNTLAWGKQRKNSPFKYVAPNVEALLHNSLTWAWWILEFIPKAAKYKQWPARQVFFGFYIPDAEPRPIPDGAFIHESVVKRMEKISDYRPVNLPAKYETWPMPVKPETVEAEV
ncbi:MAG: phospholipase effector Tle1 domain-containing protein, partial [Bradyrhizobium sp.]